MRHYSRVRLLLLTALLSNIIFDVAAGETAFSALALPDALQAGNDAATPLPLELHATIESAGIVSAYTGDDNQNARATAYYRPVGETTWLEAHPLSPDTVNRQWRGSLVYLSPDTPYEIEVRYQDPDGVTPAVITATIRTRPDYPAVGGSGVIYTVPTDGGLQEMIDLAGPGDTIQLLSGVYTGTYTLRADDSGAAGQYITIEPSPGATVIFDGSEPSVNGPADDWTFQETTDKGPLYYTDLTWADTVCGENTMIPNYAGELVEGDGMRYLLFDSGSMEWTTDFLAAPAGKAYYICDSDPQGPIGRLFVVPYAHIDPDDLEIHVARTKNSFEIIGADYIRIRGFEFRYDSMSAVELVSDIVSGADNNIIEDNTFHGIGKWGVRIAGAAGGPMMLDNLVQNNTFYERGYRDSGWEWEVYYHDGRGDVIGVSLFEAGHGTVIRGNSFTSGHDAIAPNNNSHNVDVYNNTIYECMDNGIEVDDAPGQNIRVWNNTISDCYASISAQDWNMTGHGPATIFRNVINGGDDPQGRLDHLGGDQGYDSNHAFKLGGDNNPGGFLYLYHNTIHIDQSILGEGHALNDAGGPYLANMTAKNNIWAVTGNPYDLDNPTAILNHDFDCNNLHDADPANNTFIRWSDIGGPTADGQYKSLSEFQSYTGQEANGISYTGTLFDAGYHLLPGSPDLDAGCVITGFNDRGPETFVGVGPDLGAFECTTTACEAGAIGGTVYMDTDGDGSYEPPAESVLAGRAITLTLPSDGIITATTGISGAYSFAGLPSGQYTLTLDTADLSAGYYFTGIQTVDLFSGANVTADFPVGANTTGGLVFLDTDADNIYDVISDTLLSGIVVQLQPPAGAPLTQTTNISGSYEFAVVPPDTYTATLDENSLPAGTFSARARWNLTIEDGDHLTAIDFPVSYDAGVISGTAFADLDSDGVYSPTAEPLLPGIVLSLTTEATGAVYTRTVDVNGQYTATGLPGDTYTITVAASTLPAGHYTTTNGLIHLEDAEQITANVPVRVNSLSGFVFQDLDANELYSQGVDMPYEGVVISLTATSGALITDTTDSSGDFVFRALPAGTYTATLDPASYPPDWYSPLTPAEVILANDSTITVIDLPVIPPAGIISGIVFMDADADTVYESPEDTPVADFEVRLKSAAGVVLTTTTNVSGSYAFTALPTGVYSVTVNATVLGPGRSSLKAYSLSVAGGSSYTAASFPITTNFVNGTAFLDKNRSAIYEAGTDIVLPGVVVQFESPAGAVLTATSDISGFYEFAGLESGTYTATLPAGSVPPGYGPLYETRSITVAVNSRLTGRDTPIWTNAVGGIGFLDEDANSLYNQGIDTLWNGLVIRLESSAGTVITYTTNVSGSYEFDVLSPGTYTLTVESATLPPGTFSVRDDWAITVVDVTYLNMINFPAQYYSGVITGTVFTDLDSDGIYSPTVESALPGVVVSITADSTGVAYTGTTGAGGGYALTGLPGDVYTITVGEDSLPAGHYTSGTGVVNLDNAEQATANVPIRVNSLSGFVFQDLDGDEVYSQGLDLPFEGVVISLTAASGATITDAAGYEGNFEFRALAAGTYTAAIDPVSHPPDWYSPFTPAEVTVLNDSAITVIDLPVTPPSGDIHGTVFADLDSNGVYSAASEYVLPGVVMKATADSDNDVYSGTVGTDGRYTIPTLPVDYYSLVVEPSTLSAGYYTVTNGYVFVDNGELQTAEIPVRVNSLSGFVFQDLDADEVYSQSLDLPFEGVVISLTATSGAVVTFTADSAGNFQFRALPASTYTATIDPASIFPGWLSPYTPAEVTVANNSNITVIDLPVQPPLGVVSGSAFLDADGDDLFDATESGFAGAIVQLTQTGGPVFTTTTDSGGAYAFADLQSGSYTAIVLATSLPAGHFSAKIWNVNIQGATAFTSAHFPLDVNAVKGTVYHDKDRDSIYDAGSDPLMAGMIIQLQSTAGAIFTATSDANGAYNFSGLAAGTYTLSAPSVPNGYSSRYGPRQVTILSTYNTVTRDFPMRSNVISGRVFLDLNFNKIYDFLDLPLPLITVKLKLPDGSIITQVTGADGIYTFDAVGTGTHEVSVDALTLPPGNYSVKSKYIINVVSGTYKTNNHFAIW